MKALACTLLLVLCAGTAHAQTEESAEEPVIMEAEEMDLDTSGPLAELGEMPQLFLDSLACELLGPLTQDVDPAVAPEDKNGALCSPDNEGNIAMLTAANGNVNFGLIERLNAAGFNTNTWRVFLSDPANLAQFEVEGADTLSAVIEIATAGKDSFTLDDGTVHIWQAEENALYLVENFSDGLEETFFFQGYGKSFIERRQAEALPEHREEVAEIWKRIMNEQIVRYLAARD